MAVLNGKVVDISNDGTNTTYTINFTYANPTTLQSEVYTFTGTVANTLNNAQRLTALVTQGTAFKARIVAAAADIVPVGTTVTIP
jgi:hypothetical protein